MKSSSLIVSASGVRGKVGEGLTCEVVMRFSAAFGLMKGGKILVACDTRTSSPMFRYAVFSALLSVGCTAVDLGVCPTPSLQLMVKELGAEGGIAITGSHNPPDWNALKFVRSDGLFLFPEEGKELLGICREEKFQRKSWRKLGRVCRDNSAILRHIKKILEFVDVENIRSKNFKVVIDAGNGAGALATPVLLEKLGCKTICLNCEMKGNFARLPEPVPSNLKGLCRLVKETGADVGFAHDADADRLALVPDGGEAISEEYTLAVACRSVLEKVQGPVVVNICTSAMIEDIAANFNCPVKRTPVGDVNVSRCMRESLAVIGGEGNGGVIYPLLNYARDGIMAVALALDFLARKDTPLSTILRELPSYHMIKEKIPHPGISMEELIERVREEFGQGKLNFEDGVKVTLPEGWVHIRPSGTEPILRVISEAKRRDFSEELLIRAKKIIKRCARKS